MYHFFYPESENESNGDDIVDGAAPTPKRCRLARVDGLLKALPSGLYPKFLGVTGPVSHIDPLDSSSLDFLTVLWPDSLCEHIAVETNMYARQEGGKNWVDTSVEEMWVFLGIVLQMDMKIVPTIRDHWSTDPVLGVVTVKQAMSINRFRALRRYLHCDDNKGIIDPSDISCKIKTVIEVLGRTFNS